MKILIYDLVQESNAPWELRDPALAERWFGSSITIALNSVSTINSVGIGYTDATTVTVNGFDIDIPTSEYGLPPVSGLYEIPSQDTNSLVITHNGTFIGRFGAGFGHFLGVGKAREPKFKTSGTQRFTRSNQPVKGAGSVGWREMDVDVRYKITSDVFGDIERAYYTQIMRNYPFFILFEKEIHRMPWLRFYGVDDLEWTFQSSVNRFLYSRRFSFRECY